jgi:hypothetical protein
MLHKKGHKNFVHKRIITLFHVETVTFFISEQNYLAGIHSVSYNARAIGGSSVCVDVLDEVDSVPAPKHQAFVLHPVQHNIQLLLREGIVLLLLGNKLPDVVHLRPLNLVILYDALVEKSFEMLVSRRRYLNLRL